MSEHLNRLASVLMETEGIPHSSAMARLSGLRLEISCGPEIASSRALQAALLTAANCAKRSFLGGVHLTLPPDIPLLVPWPAAATLNEAVSSIVPVCPLGAPADEVLHLGSAGRPTGLLVVCDGWRAGVLAPRAHQSFRAGPDGVLGGVMGGALGVSKAFFRAVGLELRDDFASAGISLWAPESAWQDAGAVGPAIQSYPKKFWLLGLGHLGQAYAWTLGFLPSRADKMLEVFLQDYDIAKRVNIAAGLLSEESVLGIKKTRICSAWLEARGIKTSLVERAFGKDSKAHPNEPLVALAGFDSPIPRQFLEGHGFKYIIDGGVGHHAGNFDEILIHTLPEATKSAEAIFAKASQARAKRLPLELLKEFGHGACGALVDELSKTSASTSFVGACTAALAVGDAIRGLHNGTRYEVLHWKLRGSDPATVHATPTNHFERMAGAGYYDL